MYQIFDALLPIFLLVLLGVFFKKWQFPAPSFWVTADRITYYVFLPSLIIEKLATASFNASDFYTLTIVLILVVLGVSMIAVLTKPLLSISAPSFTSVFQGSIRPNSYVALAASMALYGPEGLALTAIAMAGVIPLVNILCILSFSYYVPGKTRSALDLFKSVISNPLVVACMVGVLLNITTIGLPYVTDDIFKILSSAALPMGLISVGFGLQLKLPKTDLSPLAVSTLFKLVLLPIIAYLGMSFIEVQDLRLDVAILFSSVPCAVSSYILAGHLNGDQRMMASIITIETLAAFLTMPIIISILN